MSDDSPPQPNASTPTVGSHQSRRTLLRGSVLAAVTLSGCIGSSGVSSESSTAGRQSTETPTAETAQVVATTEASRTATPTPTETPLDCGSVRRPQPTVTEEGLHPRSYPSYPETLTAESAVEFAERFERAFQYNRFLAEQFISGTDEILVQGGVPDGAVHSHEAGYYVGVNGELKTADVNTATDGTPAPYLDAPFDAWYDLRERVGRRRSVTDIDDGVPSFDLASTVYCAGER